MDIAAPDALPTLPVPSLTWLEPLLAATTQRAVAQATADAIGALPGCLGARVLWGLGPDGSPSCEPPLSPGIDDTDADLPLARNALACGRPRIRSGDRLTLAIPLPRSNAAVLLALAGQDQAPGLLALAAEPLHVVDQRLLDTRVVAELHGKVRQLEHSERVQRALFAISDLAASDRDEPDLLKGIHGIVGTLMYAENFFIVRLDNESGRIRFLYYADVKDEPPTGDTALGELDGTLTGYLLRDGRPLRGDSVQLRAQVSGPLYRIGTGSCNWLGVPMLRDDLVEGALVVQSYEPGIVYSADDQALLEFVGSHILTALERKHRQEDLERCVRQRTVELAEANLGLHQEILERKRAERLQAALFRIAQLATTDLDEEAFHRNIHEVVGELINARNFFIGLLSEDRQRLEFPYYVDDLLRSPSARSLGRGLSEYVLRSARPLLGDRACLAALVEQGEVEASPAPRSAVCWLGVPLIFDGEAVGLVAVQSYDPAMTYGPADQELLGFVATQIANSLHRRRAARIQQEALVLLEERVQARTHELRKEIGERERIAARLKHEVMHDALTGLPNRGFLLGRLNQLLGHLDDDPRSKCALLYMDVDRFKVVNDSLGHLAGDEVLKQVASRLQACVREPDMVARLSGDEFVILLERIDTPATATRVAQRVLDLMLEPVLVDGKVLDTSTSIGIALADSNHAHADELLRDADTALYRAKSLGRKNYVVYDASMKRETQDVLWLDEGGDDHDSDGGATSAPVLSQAR